MKNIVENVVIFASSTRSPATPVTLLTAFVYGYASG
jgi:hypothetical protein